MLPFSAIYFFIILAVFIGIVYLFRIAALKYVIFSQLILFLSALYLIIYFPKPWHIALFVIYAYGVHVLFNHVLKLKHKLPGVLLLLLPLILIKSGIKISTYPFRFSEFISFAGVSYISFRVISVFIDTRVGSKIISPIRYFNYLVFIPTLLIGPIDRYARFNADAENGYNNLTQQRFLDGWKMLILGVAYKFVGAAAIDQYWLQLFDPATKDVLNMTANMYGYYFYLFFDFAGYSAMAIGAGKMLGFDVPINFNKPFIAVNPQDFWRRFHKTLGDWLRDYFFMPFYQFFSRKKMFKPFPLLRQNISLFLTFLLMGCWNGFEKHYILSGAVFGLYSVVHNTYVFYSKKKNRDVIFGNIHPKVTKVISVFIMFNLAAFAIYIFSGRCPLI
ncbi:hypothetical protein SDC9_65995 [bioreactor metagenome]|uniref:Peptidoglycan O-acetyltransferase n=1 Tax=bioreactor metagenome TaxID=1076179 RepID=A0A644XU05_9ZZZZ